MTTTPAMTVFDTKHHNAVGTSSTALGVATFDEEKISAQAVAPQFTSQGSTARFKVATFTTVGVQGPMLAFTA